MCCVTSWWKQSLRTRDLGSPFAKFPNRRSHPICALVLLPAKATPVARGAWEVLAKCVTVGVHGEAWKEKSDGGATPGSTVTVCQPQVLL